MKNNSNSMLNDLLRFQSTEDVLSFRRKCMGNWKKLIIAP